MKESLQYQGQWYDDKFHGFGLLIKNVPIKSGYEIYLGEFSKGKKEGYGM